MKGLLIKDFHLLSLQKFFFLLLIPISAGIIFTTDNPLFPIGFLTFITSILTLSTINYDEFDNGNAFLFSLPVSRKDYVLEKYLFGILLTCSGLALAVLLSLAASAMMGGVPYTEILVNAAVIFPLTLFILALTLPFQLKFGGEKGRVALICVMGCSGLFIAGLVKLSEKIGIDLDAVLENLSSMNVGMIVFLTIAVSILLLLISVTISIRIINKKEF